MNTYANELTFTQQKVTCALLTYTQLPPTFCCLSLGSILFFFFLLLLFWGCFSCFCLFVLFWLSETKSLSFYVILALLGLTPLTRWASNSQISSCLCLPSEVLGLKVCTTIHSLGVILFHMTTFKYVKKTIILPSASLFSFFCSLVRLFETGSHFMVQMILVLTNTTRYKFRKPNSACFKQNK